MTGASQSKSTKGEAREGFSEGEGANEDWNNGEC